MLTRRTLATMSSATIVDLQRVSRENLAELVRAKPDNLAVIDVRDKDYVNFHPFHTFFRQEITNTHTTDQIGGHILGSQNITTSDLDYKLPEMVRTLRDKDVVVFHCSLSQQRGPSSALRYLRERERLVGKGEVERRKDGASVEEKQKVVVLDGGFVKWQEK